MNKTIITYIASINLYNESADLFINDFIISKSTLLNDTLDCINKKYDYIESIIKDNMQLYINNKKYKYLKDEIKNKGLKSFILNRIDITQEIKTVTRISNASDLKYNNMEV